MTNALIQHWPEYLMEALLLGAFMVSACGFAVLLFHPASTVASALGGAVPRRFLMGLAMGLTAVALIYSPWGKRSGAHMNPAVTLTYFGLGKIALADAAFYIGSQCVGAVGGVLLMRGLLGGALADANVNYVLTLPGRWGVMPAVVAEGIISGLMMATVLIVSNSRFANFTGVCAGTLVMLYITFEAPISGMSINPARSFGSAFVAGNWTAFWIYLVAPLTGMFAAAAAYVRFAPRRPACAKLHHDNPSRCIFCDYQQAAAASQMSVNEPA